MEDVTGLFIFALCVILCAPEIVKLVKEMTNEK